MNVLLAIAPGLALDSLILLGVLIAARPGRETVREALRSLPDLVGLLRRLTADRSVPASARVRLSLLMVYLAVPIDVVPDFVPVLGYADDAIVVVPVLRSVVPRAGAPVVRRNWPGAEAGLSTVTRLAGLAQST
jgi:uncharacterized membrane protein YkvA (DUF1232 family)